MNGDAAKAVEQMESGRDAAWIEKATQAVRDIAKHRGPGRVLTTDDVWLLLERRGVAPPNEPRAMAAAMSRARSYGVIRTTDQTVPSVGKHCHGRPIRKWSIC